MAELQPLVSVIALCYNHQKYVEEAIESILNQTYKNIEIIIVDDASTDGSQSIIRQMLTKYPKIKYLPLTENVGNCKAFNMGYKISSGDFIIDFATDDILLPERIARGVEALQSADDEFGVNFSNAELVDQDANHLNYFYAINSKDEAISAPPEGDLYEMLIKRYFICPPTVFTKREVFEFLDGYDDTLAYEDFDFFVRSSRKFKYSYTDKVLVKRRVLKTSMSARQYTFRSQQMYSTLEICKKIKIMNRTIAERKALRTRIYFEIRQCLKTGNLKLLVLYLKLLLS